MKPKHYLLAGGITLSALVLAGAAYALGSSDFQSKAAAWVSSKCTQKLSTSKSTNTSNRDVTICYNYLDNQQQDTSIAALNSQAAPVLVDGNNDVLGPLVTPSNLAIYGSVDFYSKALNLLVPVDNQGVVARGNYLIGYTGTNCTGSPYLWEGNAGNTLSQLDAMTLVRIGSQYFAPSGLNTLHTYLSQLNSDGTCTVNTSAGQQEGISVTPLASIPYPNPLPLPVHLSSQ